MINRTGLHRTLVIHYSRQAHCATTTVVHSSRPRTRSRHGQSSTCRRTQRHTTGRETLQGEWTPMRCGMCPSALLIVTAKSGRNLAADECNRAG